MNRFRNTLSRNGVGGRDAGMTTAEYAVGTVAAAGFAGLLLKLLTSDAVSGLLSGMVEKAFTWVM